MSTVQVTTPAANLPIATSAAIAYLRALTDTDDIRRVNLCLRAATAAVEDYTGRVMVNASFLLQLDAWPFADRRFTLRMRPAPLLRSIPLQRTPVKAITSVKYWPSDGSAQVTWAASNYQLDTVTVPSRLIITDGIDAPDLAKRPDAVQIAFDAGDGTNEDAMNPMLLMAVVALARHCYDNPTAVDEMGKMQAMPFSFKYMLRSQRA